MAYVGFTVQEADGILREVPMDEIDSGDFLGLSQTDTPWLFPVYKMGYGVEGTVTPVTASAPLPCDIKSSVLPVGASTSALQTTGNASLVLIANAVEIIDDWDEGDRAKVNPIAGQAGIAGGSGVVAANVVRVTLATDDPAVDGVTSSLRTVDYAHHEIHSGSHYFVDGTASIANGANLDFLWAVAGTPKWPHALWELEAEVEMTFSMYEDVTTSANGTAVPIFNNNRNSENAAGVTAFSGPTLNSGALGDAGEGGTLIWQKTVGAGRKIGGEAGRGHELIGKQGAKYWFRITNASGSVGWVNYDFNWYEHTNSN